MASLVALSSAGCFVLFVYSLEFGIEWDHLLATLVLLTFTWIRKLLLSHLFVIDGQTLSIGSYKQAGMIIESVQLSLTCIYSLLKLHLGHLRVILVHI